MHLYLEGKRVGQSELEVLWAHRKLMIEELSSILSNISLPTKVRANAGATLLECSVFVLSDKQLGEECIRVYNERHPERRWDV